jgi:hypothetical protein
MFRIWGKIIKDHKIILDQVIKLEDPQLNRTKKILRGVEQLCLDFDIQVPMWFEKNKKEMKFFSQTSFHKDQFIEQISFDSFDIEIIEEE